MTTREIYFRIMMSTDLPIGLIGYTYKDNNNVIQIGRTICLELRTDEKIVEKSLNKMKKIEKSDGFMFWNNSPDGEIFFRENAKELGMGLARMLNLI